MKEILGDITATYRLPLDKKLSYIFFNLGRGVVGLWSIIPRARRALDVHFVEKDSGTNTPGRILINEFVSVQLSTIFQSRSIWVLDIGCGSGYVRGLLSQAGYSGKYLGVDVADYFSKESNGFESSFLKTKIEDLALGDKYNLVISNTAFEHIENDAIASQKSKEAVAPGGIEVHIVPSFWSLFCYLFHGYRQYTPRRLKWIFGDRKDWRVYSLGGLGSFLFHFFCITVGERVFKKHRPRDRVWYPKVRSMALKADRFFPVCPLIYVIVIKHP